MLFKASAELAAQGGCTKEQDHAHGSWTQPRSLTPALPSRRQAYDPTQSGVQGALPFPHPQSPTPRGLLRPQRAKGTSCCSRMDAAPPTSTPLARVPCSSSPAHCPAVIHGSSPALPYMGILHFFTFPVPGKPVPKSVFLYALQPAPFGPLAPCPGAGHRPTMPHVTTVPLCSHLKPPPPPEPSQMPTTSTGTWLFPKQQPLAIPMSSDHGTCADQPGNATLLTTTWARMV